MFAIRLRGHKIKWPFVALCRCCICRFLCFVLFFIFYIPLFSPLDWLFSALLNLILNFKRKNFVLSGRLIKCSAIETSKTGTIFEIYGTSMGTLLTPIQHFRDFELQHAWPIAMWKHQFVFFITPQEYFDPPICCIFFRFWWDMAFFVPRWFCCQHKAYYHFKSNLK